MSDPVVPLNVEWTDFIDTLYPEIQEAMVAHTVNKAELRGSEKAEQSVIVEWDKLIAQKCWLTDKVREMTRS